jgi:putative ATPase
MSHEERVRDLFAQDDEEDLAGAPLARRMVPRDLGEFVGQDHILGEGRLLRRLIESDRICSLLLYGPPGCGKTSLAHCIANMTKSHFVRLNAVTAGVADIRKVSVAARHRLAGGGGKTILFVDEVHRFNRAQQDALLPEIEDGHLVLIGATVHNPFFSIVAPLLSRSQIFELGPLTASDLRAIAQRALRDPERGLGSHPIEVSEEAFEHIIGRSEGDARRVLTALEVAALSTPAAPDGKILVDLNAAEESVQKKAVLYDRDGDEHYDTISAFIKSMRGSDPDATIYWLAKMLYAGEDPRFIARRIVICASEDVGNADPQALVVAAAALDAVEFVGMPEAQAALYVATAPKSNASASAIWEAMRDVEGEPTRRVPPHLRDAHYTGARRLGRGEGYLYPHNSPDGHVEQIYLPHPKRYYRPVDRGFERTITERQELLRRRSPQRTVHERTDAERTRDRAKKERSEHTPDS